MKENPFTFYHDGSNDNSIKKMNPTIFDINNSKTHMFILQLGKTVGKPKKCLKQYRSQFSKGFY